jgi:hypothetical protein
MREDHRMADPHAGTKTMVSEPTDQRMLRRCRLFIRILDVVAFPEAICGDPAAALNVDAASLHFEYNQALAGMEDNEIRLAVTLAAATLRLPADVMQYDPPVGELAQSLRDPAFGILNRFV